MFIHKVIFLWYENAYLPLAMYSFGTCRQYFCIAHVNECMKIKYAFFIIAIISLFFSCSDDDFSTSSSVSPLYFSADTIDLDTVFANVPTSTRTFWVYNR